MARCPDDEDWMAYLEGQASAELAAHADGCEPCRRRVEAARAAQAALAALSPGSRRLCPPPEELAEVPAGVARLSVRLHVALCAECRDDLADLSALEEEAPAEVVLRLAADGFAVLSQTLSRLAPEPLPALAARGGRGASGWRLKRELPDGELSLELAGEGRSFALSVALAPVPVAGTRVDLEEGARLLESRAMDAGLVSFLGLVPGAYRVTVRRPRAPALATDVVVGS